MGQEGFDCCHPSVGRLGISHDDHVQVWRVDHSENTRLLFLSMDSTIGVVWPKTASIMQMKYSPQISKFLLTLYSLCDKMNRVH